MRNQGERPSVRNYALDTRLHTYKLVQNINDTNRARHVFSWLVDVRSTVGDTRVVFKR